MVSLRYRYADRWPEITPPTVGSRVRRYTRYAAPTGPFGGRTNSSTTARPWGRTTRIISRRPRTGSARLRRPKAIVLASKLASSNGRFSASPSQNFIAGWSWRATSSICVLKSRPTTRPSGPAIRASCSVSFPEPHATSSAEPPGLSSVARAARRRQPASAPADSTVLTRSYLRAMRSNIVRTAAGSRSEMLLDPLPDRRDALADSDAHAAQRVPQRDRSAVDVDLLLIQPEQAHTCERLRCEGLVELDDADVRCVQPRLLECLHRRGHRADAHVIGMDAGGGGGHQPSQRLQVALARLALGHQHQRGRAVVERR